MRRGPDPAWEVGDEALEVLLEEVTSELSLEARVGVIQAKRQLKLKQRDRKKKVPETAEETEL